MGPVSIEDLAVRWILEDGAEGGVFPARFGLAGALVGGFQILVRKRVTGAHEAIVRPEESVFTDAADAFRAAEKKNQDRQLSMIRANTLLQEIADHLGVKFQ